MLTVKLKEVSLEKASPCQTNLEGVEAEIAKTKRIQEILKQGALPLNIGDTSSPLCRRYNNWGATGGNLHCEGCPIFEDTGKKKCQGTSFFDISLTIQSIIANHNIYATNHDGLIGLCDMQITYLEDLKSRLEAEEKKAQQR